MVTWLHKQRQRYPNFIQPGPSIEAYSVAPRRVWWILLKISLCDIEPLVRPLMEIILQRKSDTVDCRLLVWIMFISQNLMPQYGVMNP